MAVIEIQVISDIVCAWCYVAKRNLDQAISLYRKTYPGGKSDTFAIKWTPYYLNYNPHPYSVEKHTLVDVRLPDTTPEQREAMSKKMNAAGRAVGLNFNWGGKIGPDTRDAHRLIHLAQARRSGDHGNVDPDGEALDAVVEGLFEAYHILAQDVSEKEVLRNIALRAGVQSAEVDRVLDSDEGAAVVDKQAEESKKMANAGVPMLIIQGSHRVDSTPDPMDLMLLFVKVREEQSEDQPA